MLLCSRVPHTNTHRGAHTLSLTLLHHWLHPCHSQSYPPLLRHTVVRSSSVSCTTSFLVCLDSAGKTGKSALESSTEACDNVMLVLYLCLSLQSLFRTQRWLMFEPCVNCVGCKCVNLQTSGISLSLHRTRKWAKLNMSIRVLCFIAVDYLLMKC